MGQASGFRTRAVTASSCRSSCDIRSCRVANAVAVVINNAAIATSTVTLMTSWRPSVRRPKGSGRRSASGVLGLTVCDTLFLRSLFEVGPRRANLVMAGLSSLLVFVPNAANRSVELSDRFVDLMQRHTDHQRGRVRTADNDPIADDAVVS